MPEVDVVALRRIALLVMRASEDCNGMRQDLSEIRSTIEHMKHSIVLGKSLLKDRDRLSSLILTLPDHCDMHRTSSSERRLRDSLIGELQELVPAKC